MMQLDIEKTKIDVTEEVEYEVSLTTAFPTSRKYFTATVVGTSVEGHGFEMERTADTPDAAIKALFDSMTEVGVTL